MALRGSNRAGKAVAAVGALLVAGGFASIPFLFTQSQVRLTDKEGSLTGTQIQRGAFLNSGSKDVGVDPDWDLKTGTYKKSGTSFRPSQEDVAKFRRQHGMRDPLEVERLLRERRAAKEVAMPRRYYCDYCDSAVTNSSFRARRQHNYGFKHREAWLEYYAQFQRHPKYDPRVRMPPMGHARGPGFFAGPPPPMQFNPHRPGPPPAAHLGAPPTGAPPPAGIIPAGGGAGGASHTAPPGAVATR